MMGPIFPSGVFMYRFTSGYFFLKIGTASMTLMYMSIAKGMSNERSDV